MGVVGPLTPSGQRLREALAERAFPVAELKLFEQTATLEAQLTEFEGDVVITEPMDPDLFQRLDVIFFAGDADPQHVRAAVEQGVLTLLLAPSPEVKAPVAAHAVNDSALAPGALLVATPRPAALLVGAVLAALRRAFVVRQAVATVMVPAMELGKEAAEELKEQTINVLSFRPVPKKLLHDQLAFNLTLPSEDRAPLEAELAREVKELAGLPEAPVAIFLVRAAIFHGYALVLWVSLEGDPSVEELAASLRKGQLAVHRAEGAKAIPTPVSAGELDRIQVGRLRRDGSTRGGFWIWVVSDLSAVEPATRAIRLAEKLLGVPARRK